MCRWSRLWSRCWIRYQLCYYYTISRQHVIRTVFMKERPYGCSSMSWRSLPKPPLHIVCVLRKTRSTRRAKTDYILSGHELPISDVHNRRADSRSRDWNQKLQTTRTQVCHQILGVFTGKSLTLRSHTWRKLHKRVNIEEWNESIRISKRTDLGHTNSCRWKV